MNAPLPAIRSALSAATISLIGAAACVAILLPPLNSRIVGAPLAITVLAISLAACVVLHLAFVGILANRLGRTPWRWVLGALVTLPLGSIVALALLHWRVNEAEVIGQTGLPLRAD